MGRPSSNRSGLAGLYPTPTFSERGYARVLRPNPRGSSDYGKNAVTTNYTTGRLRIMSLSETVVDHVCQMGVADENRPRLM